MSADQELAMTGVANVIFAFIAACVALAAGAFTMIARRGARSRNKG